MGSLAESALAGATARVYGVSTAASVDGNGRAVYIARIAVVGGGGIAEQRLTLELLVKSIVFWW